MRKISLTFLIILISLTSYAQDTNKCKAIIDIAIKAVNNQTITELEKHLASNFVISNQKGKTAKLVLKQLITQLNDSIKSYSYKEIKKSDSTLTLLYNLRYKKLGEKEASFTFNNNNKILELELLKIKVKVRKKSDKNIIYPEANIIIIPFDKVGKLIGVNAFVNGKKRNFILDSGSPETILNSKYYTDDKDYKRKLSSKNMKGVNGIINNLDIVKVTDFDFSGITMKGNDILTMNLSHLESSLGKSIYGLIGYDIIKKFDILFDYENHQVTLIKPEYYETFQKEKLEMAEYIKIPISMQKHLPVVKVKMLDEVYSFAIDCGGETNLIDKNLFQSTSKNLKEIETDTLSGADLNRKTVKSAIIKNSFIGTEKFENMKTVFSEISHMNKSYKIKIDGLLGYEFLSKQKTLISFKRKEMILIK